jgi:hypothetical protein
MIKGSVSFKDALERDAVELIQDTPSAEYMEGESQRVQDQYLKNLKMTVDTANLEDAEEFMKDLMANVAQAEGLKATVADIDKWSQMTFDELSETVDSSGQSLRAFASGTSMATAKAGLDVASNAYGESYQLYNVTAGVLEDGKLSVGEAVQLGASAVSFASTAVAGLAGGAALGPIGAIAGLVLAGISYLFTSASAQEAAWNAALDEAKDDANREQAKIEAFNRKQQLEYIEYNRLIWQAKDASISEVADNWAGFEESLGVRFGLRYFPGAPPPKRAGFYKKTTLWVSGSSSPDFLVSKTFQKKQNGPVYPVLCESLSGCPYFPEPHPKRVEQIGYQAAYVEMLEQYAKKNLYLFNPSMPNDKNQQYVMHSDAVYPSQYDYFNRTLRAFDSYVGNRFWVPPVNRIQSPRYKDYRDLAYEQICATEAGICFGGKKYQKCNDLAFLRGECLYPESIKNEAFTELVRMKAKGIEYDIHGSAMKFWKGAMEDLADQGSATDVFKTRITGDLIQTANAVGGEMATALRLRQLMSNFGTTDIRTLSQDEKRSITAVPAEVRNKLDRLKQRDTILNGGMLVAGVSALGYGAYRKWK